MRRLLYWIGLLIGITACVNPQGEDVLAEAERLMQAYPDSALSLLEQAEKESAVYSRRNRMRCRLLQAEAMNKAYFPLDSITYMDEVLDYYLSHGNRDERMRACYLMGSIYRDRGNSPACLAILSRCHWRSEYYDNRLRLCASEPYLCADGSFI